MKARLLIVASLLLNLALLGAVGWFATRTAEAPPVEVVTQVVTNIIHEAAPLPAPIESPPVAPAAAAAFDWRQVESADYRAYIANLRKVGCPEQTIRDLIIADVSKLYAEKRAALLGPPKVFRFWQSSDTQYTRENVKYQDAVRALDKEKSDLIRDLLGVDLRRELVRVYGGEESTDRSLLFLTPERRAPIEELLAQYRDRERAIYAEARGEELSKEQQARVKALREEREKALAAQLSPSELKEYEMTNAGLTREIRSNLNGFDPSEKEFLAIYEARKAFEERFSGESQERSKDDPAVKAARKQAQAELEAQLAAALGDDRYAEYQRSRTGDWEDLYRVMKRYDLTQESVAAVYDMKSVAEAERRNIEQNTSLTPEQRLAALRQLALQTRQAAAVTLGDEAFKYYSRKNGRWLDRLGQPTKPSKGG